MGKKKGNIFGVPLLFCLNLLFHVDELLFRIVKFVLQESHLLTWNDSDAQAVFHLPTTLQREDPLIDEGSDIGVDVEREALNANLIDQTVNFAL